MTFFIKFFLKLITFSIMALNSIANASNFPSDYTIWSDKQFNGPVIVVRSLRSDGSISLDIAYTGSLNYSNLPLKARVITNYSEGSRVKDFNLTPYSEAYRKINEVRISTGCLKGNLGGCEVQSTDDMRHLLFWAAGPHGLNQLSLEIAVFAPSTNSWDSQYNNNYKFIFPAHHK